MNTSQQDIINAHVARYGMATSSSNHRETRPIEAWIICLNGTRIGLRSSKKVWRTIGHAKSAFRNHLDHDFVFVRDYISTMQAASANSNQYATKSEISSVMEHMLNTGVLTFVKLEPINIDAIRLDYYAKNSHKVVMTHVGDDSGWTLRQAIDAAMEKDNNTKQ